MATDLSVAQLIQALAEQDRAALLARLDDSVVLRALLPSRYVERGGAPAVADEMLGWFSEVPRILVRQAEVDAIGDLWHGAFRFDLLGSGSDWVVEQHLYCTVADGAITTVRLVCSGFQPATVEPTRVIEALGHGCATLTPRIAAAMRELASGDVLAVLTDDPAASDDLGAWSRLTGHEIVSTTTEPHGVRFHLRHA
jgi:TusA-related sulfurtransferase